LAEVEFPEELSGEALDGVLACRDGGRVLIHKPECNRLRAENELGGRGATRSQYVRKKPVERRGGPTLTCVVSRYIVSVSNERKDKS
jgi:hypothetical protein